MEQSYRKHSISFSIFIIIKERQGHKQEFFPTLEASPEARDAKQKFPWTEILSLLKITDKNVLKHTNHLCKWLP